MHPNLTGRLYMRPHSFTYTNLKKQAKKSLRRRTDFFLCFQSAKPLWYFFKVVMAPYISSAFNSYVSDNWNIYIWSLKWKISLLIYFKNLFLHCPSSLRYPMYLLSHGIWQQFILAIESVPAFQCKAWWTEMQIIQVCFSVGKETQLGQ